MASALTLVDKRPTGAAVRVRTHDLRLVRVDIAFSSTYSTGGEACDLAALDANLIPAAKIEAVYITCPTLPLFSFNWDSANKKVLAFSWATGAELAASNAGLAGKTAQALIVVKV